MDERTRHRLLMSLRCESALGLHFVEAAGTQAPEVDDDPPPVPTPLPVAAPAPLFVPAAPVSTLGGAVLLTEQRRLALQTLDDAEVKGCPKCRLCETRTHTVFGEGDPEAAIFFVGEGPGENEDLTGRPFVGRAGQLLDKMIAGMGLSREQVYIGNCVKCRPPGNRVPAPDEAATCMPYLVRQLEIVRPRAIVTLGLTAVKYMLGDNKLAMGKIRGQWQQWRGVPLMPTFHPAYVLRTPTPAVRRAVWDDLKAVLAEVGLAVPAARK